MGRNFNLTYPVILGEDVAGEVVEVGTKAKSKFAVGDRVMAHPLGLGNGAAYSGFQLYPVLKAATVSKIPDSLTFKEAAVLPLSTSTAAAGLFMKSTLGLNYPPVNPGRSKAVKRSALLVWGCSSSVGSSVVQLAPDVFSRDGLAPLLEDDEVEAYVANNTTARSASPSKRVRLAYDPIQSEKV
jgi:NADPH:quinone reductase-like Zn-dependent oxidoreductase